MKAMVFMKMNSERVPYKNIRELKGMPLFYWSINTLLQSIFIDTVYIDTDSKIIRYLIKEIWGNDFRVVVLDRPKYLLGDDVTANSLISGLLNRVEGEVFLMTHVTSPLVKVETINSAISLYLEIPNHSLIGVTPNQFNLYTEYGEPLNHNPYKVTMTQRREPVFEENSALYIFTRESFNTYGRVGDNPYLFPMSKIESLDIDTEEDWIILNALMGVT